MDDANDEIGAIRFERSDMVGPVITFDPKLDKIDTFRLHFDLTIGFDLE